MPYKNPPPCHICGKPVAAKNLCDMHYRRMKQFGDANGTLRPDDWGKRAKHPHRDRWQWTTGSSSPQGRVARWDDFWLFVKDIGEQPKRAMLRKLDKLSPWGPDNFYWKSPIQEEKALADKAAYQRKWRSQNLAKTKGYDLKRHFGLTLDQYYTMLEKQNGGCAICGDIDPYFKHMAVDHCHESGKIRGILCCACNRALGGFKDNPAILKKAVAYLKR